MQRLDRAGRLAERARREEVGVEPDDLVAGPLQHRDEDGADVAVVTGDEYAQGDLLRRAWMPVIPTEPGTEQTTRILRPHRFGEQVKVLKPYSGEGVLF